MLPLSWRPRRVLGQAAEIVLLSLLALLLALWGNPQDPLALRGRFPWVWLVPAIIALRYGTWGGLASAAVLFLGGWFQGAVTFADQEPLDALYGSLILILLCGEFGRHWNTRWRRVNGLNQYLDDTLRRLTREHYLLKLSHGRLEQYLLTKTRTLRSAFLELRHLTLGSSDAIPGAQAFLAFLGTQCELVCAGLYPPAHTGQQTVEPVATWGEAQALDANDPLVRYAIQQGALAHVQSLDEHYLAKSRYLAVVPIQSRGRLRALVAVQQMPFLAFHDETLQRMAALASYYGGLLDQVQVRYQDVPPEFIGELMRLARLQADTGIVSYLVLIRFADPSQGQAIRGLIVARRRQLDLYWPRDLPTPRLLVLLPLTDAAGMEGFRGRIGAWLEEQYGKDMAALGVSFRGEPLEPRRPLAQLERLMNAP